MSFLDELEKAGNTGRTAKGAKSNKSTLDPVLDYFASAGAMRNDQDGALALFEKALIADPELAVKALFYMRDVRGGQGERELFRAGFELLSQKRPEDAIKLVKLIPEYGRWDDVAAGNAEGVREAVAELIRTQLAQDQKDMAEGKSISLLAKWLPSENTSGKLATFKGRGFAKLLNMTPRQYRKTLSALRAHIKLLEQKMSTKQWNEVEYEKIPSQAFRKHTKAFTRHDEKRFSEFTKAVSKGEKTLNAGTVYAYEVFDMVEKGELDAADAVWKSLPDYTRGRNALVVADVSGSMTWGENKPTPISVCVSLALYFADRNKGPFAGKFLTFSENSKLQTVRGDNLADKLRSIENADWGGTTNLQSSFDAILTAAKAANTPASEMPSTLYIISDMQFDGCVRVDETNFQTAERKFREAGYELPHIVFWNVNATRNDQPATKFDNRVTLISGSSQSTFRYAVEGKTPMESMLDILNSERYAAVTLTN
jgi:hypothetical protein